MRVNPRARRDAPRVTEVNTESFTFKKEQLPPGHPGATRLAQAQQAQRQADVARSPSVTQSQTIKSHSEVDPDYHDIGLPSKFQLYPFKSLSLRTLQGIHISKFHRAHKESSLRPVVEAISSTLEPGVSAFDLMPADFYFLMYWQRVNSMPKTPMLVELNCENEAHQDEVVYGVKDPETGEFLRDEEGKIIKKHVDTLRIVETLTNTTLSIKDLEPIDFTPFKELHAKYGLGYETMKDVVATLEHIAESEDGEPDYTFLASRAAFLATTPGRESLAARIKIVETMEPDELTLLQAYMSKVTDFGVAESAVIRCKECGASTRVNISFDALTFLPGGR